MRENIPVFNNSNERPYFGRYNKLFVFCTIFILFSSLLIGLFLVFIKNPQMTCYSSSNIINQALVDIKNKDNENLLKLVMEITKNNNFSSDPNCDFIIMNYYLNISDGTNAQIYFNKFQQFRDKKPGMSSSLIPLVLSSNNYKEIIDFQISQMNQKIIKPQPSLDLNK